MQYENSYRISYMAEFIYPILCKRKLLSCLPVVRCHLFDDPAA